MSISLPGEVDWERIKSGVGVVGPDSVMSMLEGLLLVDGTTAGEVEAAGGVSGGSDGSSGTKTRIDSSSPVMAWNDLLSLCFSLCSMIKDSTTSGIEM